MRMVSQCGIYCLSKGKYIIVCPSVSHGSDINSMFTKECSSLADKEIYARLVIVETASMPNGKSCMTVVCCLSLDSPWIKFTFNPRRV